MRNPLQSPGGAGSSPFHRWSEDPFHKSPSMDSSPDAFSPPTAHPRQGAAAQTHESFPFPPGAPKHDPFAMSGGGPRPRLQHQSFEQFVRGPGPQGASPVTSPLPPEDPYSKSPLTPRTFAALHGEGMFSVLFLSASASVHLSLCIILCVSVCTVSVHMSPVLRFCAASPQHLCFFCVFCFCLIGPFNCNLFMKVSFSPDIILCG